jgi:hypothetical protein
VLNLGHDAVASELTYVTARYAALAPFGEVAEWQLTASGDRWTGRRG